MLNFKESNSNATHSKTNYIFNIIMQAIRQTGYAKGNKFYIFDCHMHSLSWHSAVCTYKLSLRELDEQRVLTSYRTRDGVRNLGRPSQTHPEACRVKKKTFFYLQPVKSYTRKTKGIFFCQFKIVGAMPWTFVKVEK